MTYTTTDTIKGLAISSAVAFLLLGASLVPVTASAQSDTNADLAAQILQLQEQVDQLQNQISSQPDYTAPLTQGARVVTRDELSVQTSPGGQLLTTVEPGVAGTIVSSPAFTGEGAWWQVMFDTGIVGWKAADTIFTDGTIDDKMTFVRPDVDGNCLTSFGRFGDGSELITIIPGVTPAEVLEGAFTCVQGNWRYTLPAESTGDLAFADINQIVVYRSGSYATLNIIYRNSLTSSVRIENSNLINQTVEHLVDELHLDTSPFASDSEISEAVAELIQILNDKTVDEPVPPAVDESVDDRDPGSSGGSSEEEVEEEVVDDSDAAAASEPEETVEPSNPQTTTPVDTSGLNNGRS